MNQADQIAVVHDVRGDVITARLTGDVAPGLSFSRGHAYQVGQVGAFVRIPLGLQDIYAVVVEVGASPPTNATAEDHPGDVAWAAPGTAWMRLELIAQGDRGGEVQRGVSRYPAVGDPVVLVTAEDLFQIYGGELSASHIAIGHVAGAPELKAMIDADKLVTRHSAVVGSTGSGKSSTVSGVLHRLADVTRFPGARVMIVDVHGEYARALGSLAAVRRVVGPEAISDASSALSIPYWALTYEEFRAITFGDLDDASNAAVQAWIVSAKRAYAERNAQLGLAESEITVDTPLPFSVRSLWFELYERVVATHTAQQNAQSEETRAYAEDGEGNELRGDRERIVAPVYKPIAQGQVFMTASPLGMRRQLDRLAGYLRDPRYDFLFRPGRWDAGLNGDVSEDLDTFLSSWLGASRPIVIADLSNVPSAVLAAVVGALLRVLNDALVWARNLPEGGRHRPFLVVLEEAHRYLSAEGVTPASAVVERVVKEGRKYGLGLMLVSQRPSEIRSTVLSQVGTFFVLRLTNTTDRGLVRSSLPDHLGGLFDTVPSLRTGEAVISGEAVRLPARVLVEIPEAERPDSSDPSVIGTERVHGWTEKSDSESYTQVVANWRKTTVRTES